MNLKYFASALLGVAVIMGPSFATAQDSDTTKKQIHQFDVFLDSRPKLGSELTHNPTLVKDPTFLKKNPELANYLKTHKDIGTELNENPTAFMQGLDAYRQAVTDFDNFLKTHPQVHNDLMKDPKLANDTSYLQKHPGLQDFLSKNASVKAELQNDPVNFMNREKGYEKWMAGRAQAKAK
jgi:hypothetical protein